jgi:FemAB-related protein (PEP-CTERM system-associated)
MAGLSPFVSVSTLEAGQDERWDAFVLSLPSATFFHLSGWKKVVEQAFAHQTFYMMAQRAGRVTGVLPLTLVRTKLFGASLISNAFCVYGGPVSSDAISQAALEDAAIELMERLRISVLEFRSFADNRADWVSKGDLYATFRKPIEPSVEHNLKAIPRKQRAMIRKGMQNGLKSEVDNDVSRLYRIYAESVRNLGTPVFAKTYFDLLRTTFPEQSDIVTVISNGRPVASVLNFYFRDEVLPYYGGGTADARRLAANDFMYWEVMRRACERGYRLFDFGRSKLDTGPYNFKRYWGFEPTPLVYQFRLAPGRKVPELNPLNPKLRLFVELWKRLPLSIATRLGPSIVRGLG